MSEERKNGRRAAVSGDRTKSRNWRSAAPATAPFPIVGIGASAGELEAFTELLKHLPLDTGMGFVLGFVLVQHLDPHHESTLPQLLSRATPLAVSVVTDKMRVVPDHVYVIPPNASLTVERDILRLTPRPQKRTPARSIDLFFEWLAEEDQRERAIGVILSGTASDGTAGFEAIKSEGGITFAQDESARYDSMPRSAIAAGCVDYILSPEQIAHELARIAKHPYVAGELLKPGIPESGVRQAERDRRPAVLADGPGQLPQSADLSRAERAEEAPPSISLCVEAERIPLSRELGIRRHLHRFVRTGGQETQSLFEERSQRCCFISAPTRRGAALAPSYRLTHPQMLTTGRRKQIAEKRLATATKREKKLRKETVKAASGEARTKGSS